MLVRTLGTSAWGRIKRLLAGTSSIALLAAAGGLSIAVYAAPGVASASVPTTVTQTFSYTGATGTFTVPDGVTALTLRTVGAEGGRGGSDAGGVPPTGGYQGVVTGTLSVVPGDVLTIAVGHGGLSGANAATGNGGGTAGSNPLTQYAGGRGGDAGPVGSSGAGGGGGGATVVQIGGSSIVAGGAGGTGGSSIAFIGHVAASSYTSRTDATSTDGQNGDNVTDICHSVSGASCDGGAPGAGGGGAQGGAEGSDEYGAGTSNEWLGYGGSPGQNSIGGYTGLVADYEYYSDNNANGSVTITYSTGVAAAPTSVAALPGDTTVGLSWTAPASEGSAPISDYVVQYAPASDPTNWTTFDDGTSIGTSTTVTGLSDGTAYIFHVAAVNSYGQGPESANSNQVTPSGPPSAPTITSVVAQDGALSVDFTAASSVAPITDYQYRIDGAGSWVSAASTTSPVRVLGLANGTPYSIEMRAVNAIGVGPASNSLGATPEATPGAPTVSSIDTGVGSATVNFTAGYFGGGTVTDYEYQLNGGTWATARTTTSPLTITGLTNGTPYAVAIRAVTSGGVGAASAPATILTPNVPDAPVVNSITPADGSVSIDFVPAVSHGSAVTSYAYSTDNGATWTAAPSTTSPIVVTGLSNGTTYEVELRAANAVGVGTASAADSVTPATVPGAPAIDGTTISGSDSHLSAAFTAP
ncbi:MAG TPA: fibronectin type III domain-containing protein, partial [Acidothermaceae bacterium]|nr:fibronectin type III domain-containing protein [Acidothermaceae bacterium]